MKYPKHIDLDLSSKCNIRCRFCHLTFFSPKEITEFTKENIKKVEPLFKNLESITLFSKYEPLTCKDFIDIFKIIDSYNIESYFSTNGTLLKEDIANTIVGKLKYLTISITGFTKETYIKNMGVDRLETVKKNISYLNKLKKEKNTKYPILRISTVGLLDAIHELKLAIDFAKEIEAEEGIQVTSFKSFSSELNHLMPLNDKQYFTKTTDEAIEYAKKQNIKFILQSGSIVENQQKTEELGHKHCNMPWYRLSIQPNGDVYPCPVSNKTIGNIFSSPIYDIWKSNEMEKFRNGVNNLEEMNEDCKNCTHCRHRSITNINANDYSSKEKYIMGMKRK
ncbi:hypothetical protein CP960_13535 [Malaciobacter halophilus]|uniref:Radical SAM core domain-containing protein n=1 Tax=Malaciobacter halophilus TaxID=197482 RepID=A0A2N1IZA9_9BACT|nr:radical SAM protein [Malaciobacter halophilus]AXH10882.1 radical SAM superfamily enzyme, MoaA/NifB/PqqE/SkfB family [Malaciobacter halophilus]PKI79627.1 hypothetical protein CP960_13535 [Malaciobacter halophilus]